ncbi:MAG: glycosyltransferase family 4 protein [Gemmatimonadales bacterium]|nr:glycosyltransferase family 4 protein [Gemmatimonadales bacterium]
MGGQASQAELLVAELEARGVASVEFVPQDPLVPGWLRWIKVVPVLRTILSLTGYVALLARALARSQLAHVFTASYWSFVLSAAPAVILGRVLRTPVLINYHSGEAEDHLTRFRISSRLFLRWVSGIVVPSRYLVGVFHSRGYSTTRIPNAVAGVRFAWQARPQPRQRFLSTRNLEPTYDIPTVVRAFALIHARVPGATLTLVGSGSQAAEVGRLVQELELSDCVHLVGRVPHDEIEPYYRDADVFLNASVVDNQPLSLLEAMASGLCVVTTDVGGISDFIRDGHTGLLVPPQAPQALADAALRALRDPALFDRLVQAAREVILEHDVKVVVDKWRECYARVSDRDVDQPLEVTTGLAP